MTEEKKECPVCDVATSYQALFGPERWTCPRCRATYVRRLAEDEREEGGDD